MKHRWWLIAFLFIGPLILFTSCARNQVQYTIVEDVSPLIAKFEMLCDVQVEVTVKIVDELPPSEEEGIDNRVGICRFHWYGNHPENEIQLLRSYWNRTSPMGQEELLFHELGHCVLGRSHLNWTYDWGQPRSIMFWLVFGDSTWYYNDRTYYYGELCGIR
jgi:hypothetical protein